MHPSALSERKFGLTVGGVFLVFGLIALWRAHPVLGTVLVVPGSLLVLGGLIVPAWLAPVERRWMAMAAVLGAFNFRVILTLAYYLIVSPVGIVLRLLRRDALDRRLGTADSYWHRRPPEPPATRERYIRQY